MKNKKLVLAATTIMIALTTVAAFSFLRPGVSSPGRFVGLQLLARPGLAREAYLEAAASVVNDLWTDGMMPLRGQDVPEADSFFDVFVTMSMEIETELQMMILGGTVAPEAMDIAVDLMAVVRDGMMAVQTDAAVPFISVPPPTPVPDETSRLKYQIVYELPPVGCINAWKYKWAGVPGTPTPQIDEKEGVVTRRYQSFVVVEKVHGVKLFRIWRWWPYRYTDPTGQLVIKWFWVVVDAWLPAEYIKTIIITPGGFPEVSITSRVYVDVELADFLIFFRKDP